MATAEPAWNYLDSIYPFDVHLHFVLFVGFFERSVQCETSIMWIANKQMKCGKLCEMLKRNRCYGCYENKLESFQRTSWHYTLCSWELQYIYLPIRDYGVSRAAACTICSSQFLLRDAWNLGLIRLRTWPVSASNIQKTAGGWRNRIASPRRAIKPQHSETGIMLWHVVM